MRQKKYIKIEKERYDETTTNKERTDRVEADKTKTETVL